VLCVRMQFISAVSVVHANQTVFYFRVPASITEVTMAKAVGSFPGHGHHRMPRARALYL
jgi:hypothetical protein